MIFKNFFRSRSPKDKALNHFLKSTFGIIPKSLGFYKEALTHSSILPTLKKKSQSNERLEFLGDAILDSIIATFLYNEFSKSTEGKLTKLKAKLVSRKHLNEVASKINLESFLEFSINSKTRDTSLLGNALEAVIGAIFLDLGYKKTEKAVQKLFSQLDLDKVLNEQKDYKSLLYEWAQQQKKEVLFRTVEESKMNGRTIYKVEVVINNAVLGMSSASSKKKAQQKASEIAFSSIKGKN